MSKAVDFSFINPSDIMLKSEYDTNLNSIVDVAASVQGVDGANNNTFYGKVGGIAGFYSVQTEYGINDLTDVTITTPSSGQYIKYNGTRYVNSDIAYNDITGKPTLSSVATSGSYNDLSDKPVIPAVPDSVGDLSDVDITGISNGQVLQWSGSTFIPANVSAGGAGSLNELSDVTLTSVSSGQILKYNGTAFVNTTIDYSEVSGTPTLSTVATSGSYNDLSNKPVIFSGSYNDLSGKPVLSTVATSGSYNDLSEQPSIPTSLRNLSDVAYLAASSGQVLRHNGTAFTNATLSYNDLSDTPVIPSVPDSIGDLSDVNITGISSGQVLQWNGSSLVPATISGGGGGASTLNDLTDVNVSSATSGQVLQYNGTGWIPATVAGGSGNTTVERIRIQYTGADMAAGTVGTSECYSGYSANVTPILASNNSAADFITEISFTGYNYPPSHIMYYGFNGANNRYEIRPLYGQAAIQYVPNNTTDLVNPSPFGGFDKIRLTTASTDTGAAPKTGLPTTPGHAWIVLVMQG